MTPASALATMLFAAAVGSGDVAPASAPGEQGESATSLPTATATTARPSLLVLETRIDQVSGVDAAALTNLISSVVAELERFQVMSHQEVAAMLDTEAQKQLTGCSETACMAEIGAALGADFLLYSHLGRVGDEIVCSVSLIDARAATATARQSLVVPDVRQVADAARVVTLRTMGEEAELQPLADAGFELGPLKWTVLGTGALLAAAGGVGTAVALYSAAQARQATSQEQFDTQRSSGDISNAVAVTGYAAGATLLAASAVLFVLDALTRPEVSRPPAQEQATAWLQRIGSASGAARVQGDRR